MKNNVKVIIAGATSGIGNEIAKCYIRNGYTVGVIGRRPELLENLKALCPDSVFTCVMDINDLDADKQLLELVKAMGDMDIYFHVSGIGYQNISLDRQKELATVETNCLGFTRMVAAAFNYFANRGCGHIAAVTSIAGTKGLGSAPAYSASKRFQNHYLQSLSQLARIRKLNIQCTDIRPGFVATDLLKDHHYPMLMTKEYVGKKAYEATRSQRRVQIIDWRYAIVVFFWQLIPRYVWERMKIK